ncbi:hypothetical protein GDO86_018213 [Hymenochirus boettgeri]|uniref:Uncharacterized protein n=1 Tax=Hymenochirus boettgeri TaxID=247094 RepID=A0A8T2IJJ6_9PIPI|nr:hypothetical protein GDO86_018213 [Hymenochirus boettgeri]
MDLIISWLKQERNYYTSILLAFYVMGIHVWHLLSFYSKKQKVLDNLFFKGHFGKGKNKNRKNVKYELGWRVTKLDTLRGVSYVGTRNNQ